MNKIKNNKTLLILIGIMILSSIWLITKGMSYSHDIYFHYGRIVGLARTIKTGDIIAPIHNYFYGYGYATGLFYNNLFFYIPALLSLMGVSYIMSLKIMYILINILTTLSIYFCTKSITKDKKISLITTVLYMFSGYRILDIFVRGAMGEMLSFMIIPIVILGLYEITFRDYKKWYLFTIGFVLLVLSHLITTALMAVFSLLFILINYKEFLKDKNRIKYLFISGIVGLLLGTFFLIPVLEQKLNGNINIFKEGSFFLPQDDIVSFKEFLIPNDFFNKNLGLSLILLLPIRYFIRKKDVKDKTNLRFADIFLILSIIAWVSTTKIFPWSILGSKLEFIQFPWRLLIVSTTFLCFAYAIYFKVLAENKKKNILRYAYSVTIVISLIYISLYSVQYGLRKKQYNKFPLHDVATGEYLPYKTDVEKLDYKNPSYKTNNPAIVIDCKKNGTNIVIKYSNNKKDNTYIEVPLLNYLGYSAKGAKLENGNNNLIRLTNLEESGEIRVSYKGTTTQKISYLISLVSLGGFVVYIIIERKK